MNNILYIGDNLSIMKNLRSSSINCIYTDPPYLTNNKKLTYSDSMSEEDWIDFMTVRFKEAHRLLLPSGTLLVHIDERMHIELKRILYSIFDKKNSITTFIWKKRSSASNQSKFVTVEHEYILAFAKDIKKCKWNGIPQFEKDDIKIDFKTRPGSGNVGNGPKQTYPLYYNKEDDIGLYEDHQPLKAGERHNINIRSTGKEHFPLYYNQDGYRLENLIKHKLVGTNTINSNYPIHTNQTKISLTPFPGSIEVFPMNGAEKGCWRCIPITCQKLIDADMLIVKNGKIYQKQYAHFQYNIELLTQQRLDKTIGKDNYRISKGLQIYSINNININININGNKLIEEK